MLTVEEEIKALQAELLTVKQPQQQIANVVRQQPMESQEAMISRLIDEKLNTLLLAAQHIPQVLPTPTPQVSQQSSTAPEPISLLSAIGSALTEQQQLWLSDAKNQTHIPEFLMTAEGKAIIRRFMSTYTEYRSSKCK